jgi:hypothetical protein
LRVPRDLRVLRAPPERRDRRVPRECPVFRARQAPKVGMARWARSDRPGLRDRLDLQAPLDLRDLPDRGLVVE